LKRLVGHGSFKNYFLDYLRNSVVDIFGRVYDKDGTLHTSKLGFNFPGNDRLAFDDNKEGADGSGHILQAVSYEVEDYNFENQTGNNYDVGLHYAEKPVGIQINPRTAYPEYQRWEELVGVSDEPVSVTDQGGGVYRFRLPTSMCPWDRTCAGRKCLVWMKTPAKGALTEAIAVIELTVEFSTYNYVDVDTGTYTLGQTIFSVDETKYAVLLRGPTIARTGDLDIEAAADYWYIGEVTGNGPSATPTTSDITDQRLITKSLSDWLENLVYDNVVNTFTRKQIITPSVTDEDGLSVTGNGTGGGIHGTGGSSSGQGLRGTGGAPNGEGASGEGVGTGVGVSASSSGTRAPFRMWPRTTPTTGTQNGDVYPNSADPYKVQHRVNAEWRTVAEKKTTRTFLYPIACGVPDHQVTEPHWYWNASLHQWNSDNLVTPEYLVFDLNRFVPQGATLYAVRLYENPGWSAGRATKGNRSRIQLMSEDATGGDQTEHFRAYFPDETTDPPDGWMYLIGGTHDGGDDQSILTDSWQNWTTDELVGRTIYNLTDGSSGTITANTATTVTAALSGGDNDWDDDDVYKIDLDETINSDTRQWFLVLWSGNDNQVDILHSLEIKYIENDYLRVP